MKLQINFSYNLEPFVHTAGLIRDKLYVAQKRISDQCTKLDKTIENLVGAYPGAVPYAASIVANFVAAESGLLSVGGVTTLAGTVYLASRSFDLIIDKKRSSESERNLYDQTLLNLAINLIACFGQSLSRPLRVVGTVANFLSGYIESYSFQIVDKDHKK